MRKNRFLKFLFSARCGADFKQTIRRILILAGTALILGLAANHLHPAGMPLRLMTLPLTGVSTGEAWRPLSADSAFVLYLQKAAVFWDVRPETDFGLDHIPGARSVPFPAFFRNPERYVPADPGTTLVLYDFEDYSSRPRQMIQWLLSEGYSRVYQLRNGYSFWLDRGYPRKEGNR